METGGSYPGVKRPRREADLLVLRLKLLRILRTYLLIDYLTALSVAQTIQHGVVGRLVNNELEIMTKETVEAYFYIGETEENHENFSHDGRFPGRDLNAGPLEYEVGVQPT
jgi:hypothetical protein